MTHQQLENVERAIAGLTVQDKQELIERLQRSIRTEMPGTPKRSRPAPKSTRRIKREKPIQQKEPATEAELLQYMLSIGMISRLPDPSEDIDDDDPDDEPVVIRGEPLSETIIRERR